MVHDKLVTIKKKLKILQTLVHTMEKLAPMENTSLGGIWAQMGTRADMIAAAVLHCVAREVTFSASSWTVFWRSAPCSMSVTVVCVCVCMRVYVCIG